MKHNRLIAVLLLLIFTTMACSLPAIAPGTHSTAPGISIPPLLTLDPQATITPTPFLPSGYTPEPTVQTTPVTTAETSFDPTDTLEPTFTFTPTTVPLINRLKRPAGQVNILLMGTDYRPGKGFRTDVMMLVCLNPLLGTASVISFPRDLYVYIPGWQYQRINTAHAYGGFSSTVDTFEYNFGVTPDHYILTNMEGFTSIIDTLGGITVYASRGLSDKCDLPQKDDEGYCNVDAGPLQMDGATALWYVRSRYTSSDFDRTRRAQEVIQGVFLKMLNLNGIARAPELYNLFRSSVETDMSVGDILPLLPLASNLADTSKIDRYAVGPSLVTSWTTENGASVLLPHTEGIWEIIKKAAYNQ